MIVTEIKKIKYDSNCKKHPVFITWLNTLGGWEQWLFDTTYIDTLATSRSETFEGYIQDLQTANAKVQDVQLRAQPSITVFGMIDNEDIHGLKTILYSLSCKMLLNPMTWQTEGVKFITIRPQPGSFRILDQREKQVLIEIVFDLPYLNTQRR